MDRVEVSYKELTEDDAVLVKEAIDAMELSYSPYSNFTVGSAVRLANGCIVKGANQENASYPVGICAERSAIYTAQNLYPNVPVTAIALAGKKRNHNMTNDFVTPCGMCRQAIAELELRYKQPVRILMCSSEKVAVIESVSKLLPWAFC